MKINEYTLLEMAFENSFGFMLNRLADCGFIKGDQHDPKRDEMRGIAKERCFAEFMIALEELGVELGETEVKK